jgi:hypothetical protein
VVLAACRWRAHASQGLRRWRVSGCGMIRVLGVRSCFRTLWG